MLINRFGDWLRRVIVTWFGTSAHRRDRDLGHGCLGPVCEPERVVLEHLIASERDSGA
jgi:hypothetical protein